MFYFQNLQNSPETGLLYQIILVYQKEKTETNIFISVLFENISVGSWREREKQLLTIICESISLYLNIVEFEQNHN